MVHLRRRLLHDVLNSLTVNQVLSVASSLSTMILGGRLEAPWKALLNNFLDVIHPSFTDKPLKRNVTHNLITVGQPVYAHL